MGELHPERLMALVGRGPSGRQILASWRNKDEFA